MFIWLDPYLCLGMFAEVVSRYNCLSTAQHGIYHNVWGHIYIVKLAAGLVVMVTARIGVSGLAAGSDGKSSRAILWQGVQAQE
jgi:hypothetical protein